MLTHCTVYAPSAHAPAALSAEARQSPRRACHLDATSQPFDAPDTLAWGGVVCDLSAHGIGLSLCFPFRTGTTLAVELKGKDGTPRVLRAAVVHARDRADGSWLLGCAFDTPLTAHELDQLV